MYDRTFFEVLIVPYPFDQYRNTYRPGHSRLLLPTDEILPKLSDNILKYLDNSEFVRLILLDLYSVIDILDLQCSYRHI